MTGRSILRESHATPHHTGCFPQPTHWFLWIPATKKSQGDSVQYRALWSVPCIAEGRISLLCHIDVSLLILRVLYKKVISKRFEMLFLSFLAFFFMIIFHTVIFFSFFFFFAGSEFFTQPDCSYEGSFCIFFFVQTDSRLYPF